MDKEIFVQNVKRYCDAKGVKPTVACRESGVGTSFINNIEKRHQTPSVEKVQMLAQYLGVTTSELLGEEPPDKEEPTPKDGDGLSETQKEIMRCVRQMSSQEQAAFLAWLQASQGRN